MAPTSGHYNYLVIGGGSGGVASSRRAAKLGAKALVIEGKHIGGTCVNVGCVPKKVMWNASDIASKVRMAKGYDFDVPEPRLDWNALKLKRDAYIERLRGIYERNLSKEGVDLVYGWAEFVDAKTVKVQLREGGEATYTADHILIATGGTPSLPDIKGAEHGISSDGFFELAHQPKSVAIVGGGYIGVELAGVFNSLGTEVHLFIRGETVLRKFDDIISTNVTNTYIKHGVHIHKNFKYDGDIEKLSNGKVKFAFTASGSDESKSVEVDELIFTIGRRPLSEALWLEKAGVKFDKDVGTILVDEYQNTTVNQIYAVGDVSDEIELTPVAIAAGRKLAERIFAGKTESKLDFTNVPSVIFSHPEVGTIGLSEVDARRKYGDSNIKVYRSRFINMLYSPLDPDDKLPTEYKIVCEGPNEKVVGLHLFGDSSAEILQGFGVAIKMGATKADFDSCVAIHPTAAEELVTMT